MTRPGGAPLFPRKTNPANAIKDTMRAFLMDKGQKANIPALKSDVYDLIQMTTQKTSGQSKQYVAKSHINWEELDMTLMSIVIRQSPKAPTLC